MARRMGYAGCLLLLMLANVPAQEATLRLRLAPDREETGPAAWSWLRRELLGTSPHWPAELDPKGGVQITIEYPYRLTAMPSEGPEARADVVRCYFAAKLRIKGVGELTGRCDFQGRERWTGHRLQPITGRLAHLRQLAGMGGPGPVALDSVAWLGNLAIPTSCRDPLRKLLVITPLQCGTVRANIHFEASGRVTIVSPQGNCGLLLPTMLAVIADTLARPEVGGLLDGPVANDLERWLSLARAGVGLEREQATRQLSMYQDPRARDALERLLYARDGSRLAAMQGLVRMGAVSSLPKILAAASPKVQHSRETANAAMRALWSKATPTERRHLASVIPLTGVAGVTTPPTVTARHAGVASQNDTRRASGGEWHGNGLIMAMLGLIALSIWLMVRQAATVRRRARISSCSVPLRPRRGWGRSSAGRQGAKCRRTLVRRGLATQPALSRAGPDEVTLERRLT